MCGIAGIVDLKATREVDASALKRMSKALIHRGPDGEGYFFAPGVGLGHRRLAIIDPTGGAQPFQARHGSGVLSFNGEIYNFQDLVKDLGARGVGLNTRSDTEVLAEGWAQEGTKFVHKLRGMFAISFWDPETSCITLARDRLGERPLYYAETSDGFLLFASEIGSLLASGLVERHFNNQAIADYFYYGYVSDPYTIYKGIHKLPPGHLLYAGRSQKLKLERYWRPVFAESDQFNFEEASSILLEKIDEAVAVQSIADVPFGAFLSGGVDSAGIVSAMAQTGGPLVTCTVGFNEKGRDEREYAREIATQYGSDHHELLSGLDIFSLIDKVALSFGEPFADSSALASYVVAQLARQHVTVALSGDGGDELFAGYRRYPFHLAEEKARRFFPLAIRRAIFGSAGAVYPKLDWAPRPLRAKSTLQSLGVSSAEAYAASVAINLPKHAKNLMSTELRHELNGYAASDHIANVMAEADTDDKLAQVQYADMMTWLPGRMLTKTDRASMAHSLEVRPPLLDHKVVEWAGLLPASFKLEQGVGKRVLKSALTPRLGQSFIERKKQGFDLPIVEWLRREDKNPLERLQMSTEWRECGFINEGEVDRMVSAHRRGSENCAQALWSVVMFDAFLRNVHNS